MMPKLLALAAIALFFAGALAGCAGNDETPTPGTTTPPTSTPPTTTPPATTPVVTPPTLTVPTLPVTPPVTPPTTLPVGPVISSVYVVSAPVTTNANTATVCWRVGGSGTSPHVALHYDTTSHPLSTNFADYTGGAVYPNNATAADPAGYKLPGAWCANVPVRNTTYLRAHALAGTQSVLSAEKAITSDEEVVDFEKFFPQVSASNSTVKICWQAQGPGPAIHTAVHFDFVSHPNATSFQDYAGGAFYAENDSKTLSARLSLPGDWCVTERLLAEDGATYYMRAHVRVNRSGNVTDHLGPERSISVTPALAVTNGLPETAPAGSDVLVCWRAEGEGKIPHTALHFDNVSRKDEMNVTFGAYKGGAVYPGNATAATNGGYSLPGPWCANLKMPASGALYFVAHALNPGARDELSHEYMIRVA